MYNHVLLTQLDLSDQIESIAGSGQLELTMFHTVTGPIRFYDFKDNVQFAVTYELSLDLHVINRKVYGLLDFLGDIGGLTGSLRAIFTLAIMVFQHKAALNETATRSYLIKDGEELSAAERAKQSKEMTSRNKVTKRIPIGFFGGIKLSFQRLLPCCRATCCQSRRDKLSHKAD